MKTIITMKSIGKPGLTVAVAILALAASASAGAQAPGGDLGMGPHHPPMERAMGPRGMGEHSRWWNDQHTIEKYKLTDAQRKSMDDVFQQHRTALIDQHAALEKAEAAMEPMMREDQPDEAKILAQIDVVAQARAELEKANARMLLELRRQLTPEQWKQIQADRAARRNAAESPNGPAGPGGHWRRQPGGIPGGQGAPPPPANPGPGPVQEE